MSEAYVIITGDNELEIYFERENRQLLLLVDEIDEVNGSYHLLGFDGQLKGVIKDIDSDSMKGWVFNGPSEHGDIVSIGLTEDFVDAVASKAKEGDFMR